jgi:hypothetical protein
MAHPIPLAARPPLRIRARAWLWGFAIALGLWVVVILAVFGALALIVGPGCRP